eukprot:TRINITY_DN2353_c0_g1_i4.p1 TRINITY_DN2353_c0_g1~~TRINITY_DN2353_c0_g1_i4.p1  ORF type:complete len:216 (-),score=18.75 TRINITY_DN2353_c0_g1_i4:94-741(-)
MCIRDSNQTDNNLSRLLDLDMSAVPERIMQSEQQYQLPDVQTNSELNQSLQGNYVSGRQTVTQTMQTGQPLNLSQLIVTRDEFDKVQNDFLNCKVLYETIQEENQRLLMYIKELERGAEEDEDRYENQLRILKNELINAQQESSQGGMSQAEKDSFKKVFTEFISKYAHEQKDYENFFNIFCSQLGLKETERMQLLTQLKAKEQKKGAGIGGWFK